MCVLHLFIRSFYVINFEINHISLIKPFFYMIKKSRQKFKYLEKKKSFEGELKSVFHQKLSQT